MPQIQLKHIHVVESFNFGKHELVHVKITPEIISII